MDMNRTPTGPEDQHDELIAGLLRRAYAVRTDLDTAARHLYAIHAAAGTVARTGRVLSRGLAATVCALAMFASSGVAIAASSSALPGDSLYSVKRGVEQVRLLVAFSAEDEARVLLDLAERRLAEADRAAQQRPEVVEGLLSDATRALAAADALATPELVAQVERVRSRTADLELAVAAPPPAPALVPRDEEVAATDVGAQEDAGDAGAAESFTPVGPAPALRDGVPPPLPPPPPPPPPAQEPQPPAEAEEQRTEASTAADEQDQAEPAEADPAAEEPAPTEEPSGDEQAGPDDQDSVEDQQSAVAPGSRWRPPGRFAPGPKRDGWPSPD